MQEFLIDIEEEHDNCVWQRDMSERERERERESIKKRKCKVYIDKIIDSKIF